MVKYIILGDFLRLESYREIHIFLISHPRAILLSTDVLFWKALKTLTKGDGTW